MNINRMHTAPLNVPRTNRNHRVTAISSFDPGKMAPIFVAPLLREDAVRLGRMRFSFELQETAEILMNPVNVALRAYLVPSLAFERFEGSRDQFDRSYAGQPRVEGDDVVPFFEKHAMGAHGSNAVYKTLGIHGSPTDQVNTMYLEAYNAIWNFRAKNRSPDIPLRDRLDGDLADAFWEHQAMAHIVPNFDQAKIDGEVLLNVVNAKMPVKGIGTTQSSLSGSGPVRESGGESVTYPYHGGGSNMETSWFFKMTETGNFPDIWAELQDNGIKVSLSNLELARKTQAFARLREQYTQHSDEWIIDMLMSGLQIPDQAFKQPMLLAEKRTVFGMSKRYATDAENLTESVVNGATYLDLELRTPRISTGGVIMVVAEVTPEQLWERMRDPFFHIGGVSDLPDYLRDELDPEKVSVVTNDYVDTDHDTPEGTFGYAPLNHEWNRTAPTVGGKFYRPDVDAGFDEDRQRIWAVETKNPSLSADFYLCRNMHKKPFVDQVTDAVEVMGLGNLVINGNTVFGGALIEASDDYEKVLAKAPQDRIEKED